MITVFNNGIELSLQLKGKFLFQREICIHLFDVNFDQTDF